MQSDTGTPLSFPLVLKHGEYASVPFTTDERWSYWLTLEFNHLPRTFENLCEIGYYEDCKGIEPVAFNWQLIDDKGAALQEGKYKTRGQQLFWWTTGWQETWRVVIAGVDRYSGGQRRLVLKVLHDASELDAFDPTLKVGFSTDAGEAVGYSFAFACIWAFWVGGFGLVVVFGPTIWKLLCAIFPRIKPS